MNSILTGEKAFIALTKSLDAALVNLDAAMEHFEDSVLMEQDLYVEKTPEEMISFQKYLEGYITMSGFLIDHPLITTIRQIRDTNEVTNTDACICAIKHSFKVGQKWKHYKGNVYTIVSIAKNSDSPHIETIHYTDGDKVWELSISGFAKKVTVDNVDVPRFTLVE